MKSNLNLETGRSHTSTSLPPLRTTRRAATHSLATRFRRRLGRAQLPLLALLALLALALTLPVRAAPPLPITALSHHPRRHWGWRVRRHPQRHL